MSKLKKFLFANQTSGQTVVKNTFWLTVGKFGGKLLRTIIIVYGAHALGAAGWGVFSYAISLTAVFSVVADFGVSPLLIKEMARGNDSEKKEKVLSTAFFLKIFMLAPAVVFILFFAERLPLLEGIQPLLGLFAFMLVFDSLRQLGFSLIRANELMELQAGLFLLVNVVIVVSGLVFLSLSPSIYSLTYAFALGSAVGLFATAFVLRSQIGNILKRFDWVTAKEILSSAWPFSVSGLLGSIMIFTDIFIIGIILKAEDVGFYSVAYRMIQLLYAPALILAASTFPLFSRLAYKNDEKVRDTFNRILRIMYLVLIPVTVGGILVAPGIITVLFGTEYLAAVRPFQVLLLTLPIRFVSILLVNTIFAYDQKKTLVFFAVSGAGLNILFDFFFIPSFGITGSAFATLFAQIISGIYLFYKMKPINNFTVLPNLKYIFPATAVMALVVWFISGYGLNLFFIICFSIVIYTGLLFLMGESLLKEIRNYKLF